MANRVPSSGNLFADLGTCRSPTCKRNRRSQTQSRTHVVTTSCRYPSIRYVGNLAQAWNQADDIQNYLSTIQNYLSTIQNGGTNHLRILVSPDDGFWR